MADLVRTLRNARRVAPPSARPISTTDAALMQGIGAGSGVIDPTRTATDPAEVERIRRQNQGYAFDFVSSLLGRPVRPDGGSAFYDITDPNMAAQWASLLAGGKIPDKTIPSRTPGITISRVPGTQHPWSWMGESTARLAYPRGSRPPLYVSYQATNARGAVVGGFTMGLKRHGPSGDVVVRIPVAWTDPNLMRTPLLDDMMSVPRATGLPVKVAKSQYLAHHLMKQYGHG